MLIMTEFLIGSNDKVLTGSKVLHCDVIMFSKNPFSGRYSAPSSQFYFPNCSLIGNMLVMTSVITIYFLIYIL